MTTDQQIKPKIGNTNAITALKAARDEAQDRITDFVNAELSTLDALILGD